VFYNYRKPGDTLGTLSAPATVIAGAGIYTGTRWGDYSMAAVDPVDGQSVWVFQEYVDNGKYRIYTQRVLADAPVAISATGNTQRRGGTVVLTVTGTDFFDGPAPASP
ncbi:MAG: hypothetical protein C4320_08105, partial [Armatimonadota bacterium]